MRWVRNDARRRTAKTRYAAYGCTCQGLTRFTASRQTLLLLATINGRLPDSISLSWSTILAVHRVSRAILIGRAGVANQGCKVLASSEYTASESTSSSSLPSNGHGADADSRPELQHSPSQ